MGKVYPELCGSKDEAATETHLQMLLDTDEEMTLRQTLNIASKT